MSSTKSSRSGIGRRIGSWLFPPMGVVWVWQSSRGWGSKLVGTFGLLLLTLLYVALVIWGLVRADKVKIEWRGGYLPALTFRKTEADYAAIEKHRAAQRQPSASTAAPRSTNGAAYWTGFRGPNRDGIYREQPISTNWPAAGLPLLWKQPCGGGYASFVVAHGTAFTIEQRREQEVVVAYALENATELWTHGWNASFSEPMGGEGPRATPAFDQGRVYALGALGELRCLDAMTGESIWSTNLLRLAGAGVPTYGVSASPLLLDEKLIVLTAARQGRSVVCCDKNNGQVLWSALDDETGYSSPISWALGGQTQVIVSGETRTVGLNLENGKLVWEAPWRVTNNQLPIAQPVIFDTNKFMLSAGYFTGCAGVEVVSTNNGFTTRTLWKNKYLKNKFTSSVFWDGYIYGLDEDILTCLDSRSGERKWKGGRYGYGQLVGANGHLIILCGDGDLALVKADPAGHQEVARFPAIHGKTWNHPALAEGKILVRNAAEMACFALDR